VTRVYEEIIDFISSGTTSKGVASWQPSKKVKTTVERLLAGAKAGSLSPDDTAELNHYLELEHVMRLAKARARQRLSNE